MHQAAIRWRISVSETRCPHLISALTSRHVTVSPRAVVVVASSCIIVNESPLAGTDTVSMDRSPEANATGAFVLHTTLSSLKASPGTRVTGVVW